MANETDHKLQMPFFTDDPAYARGFEAGMLFARIERVEYFENQPIHRDNKEQIELICVEMNAPYKFERLDDTWYSLTVKP